MLQPKTTKYRKPHRVSYEGKAKGGDTIVFGAWGLQALEGNWITARQIESGRIAINRYMKRNGKIWIRIFPHMIRTKKPLEVRMGKGKGSPDHYVAVVKKGTILYEINADTDDIAKEELKLAMHKMPVKCKIIRKNEVDRNA